MAIPRKDQIDTESGGYYHLISRCVRRAFLCGNDPETQRNFEHRREWIENRILELAQVFAIEVYAYAVMHNHYHLVVYLDPKAPQSWSDLEVAERWLKVFPGKLDEPRFKTQRALRIQAIVADKKLLAEYRSRLGSLSWLMRRINEPLARMANAEDCCKGHFWESRFKSQALLDEAAVLACMAYVDLNPIRAGLTNRLEDSEHVSVQRRIRQLTDGELEKAIQSVAGDVRSRTMVIPLKDYLTLVEWTGKSIQTPGKTSIPANLSPIFKRLNINQAHWLTRVQYFGSARCRVIGCLHKVQQHIEKLGQKWLQGIKRIQPLYLSSE